MLSAKIPELYRSLAFRLMLWHAGLLLLALALCYVVSYLLASSLVLARADAYLKTEADECARFFALQHESGVREEAAHEAQQEGTNDLLLRITDPAGKILFETSAAAWSNLHVDPQVIGQVARSGQPQLITTSRGGPQPQVRVIVYALSSDQILVIANSIHGDLQSVHESMHLVLAVMLGVWVLAGVVGFFLARRAMGGIYAVRDAAIDFAEGRTPRRVEPTHRGDEVDLLANAFNAMAERITALLANLRQTNDSLAHELRSPITGIRGRCELALTHPPAAQDPQLLLAETIERCDHMLAIINTILELSETDAGVARLAKKEVDLGLLLANASDIFGPVAEDAGVALHCRHTDPAVVVGDPAKLQRLFSNLIDNAVKYSPWGGAVSISLEADDGNAFVAIQDSGPGIAPDEREKIFERFYRGSAAEGRPGNGLGLSLARTIARAHGGDITVTSEPGQGALVVVRIPVAPHHSATKYHSTDVTKM